MRLWPILPLISEICAIQVTLQQSGETVATTSTLVDALSADKDYESVLRLLQRARLIPTLNKLVNGTFFAPNNEAVSKSELWSSALLLPDNRQDELRDHLLYHLLNYTISITPEDDVVQVHKTLHFPRDLEPPPTDEPAPAPPWLPMPGGSLGGEPQRLRLIARKGNRWIGVDAEGLGGVKIVKDPAYVGNGVLLGVDAVIPLPPDLATLGKTVPYFERILTPHMSALLNGTDNMTVFLPVEQAWLKLHALERLYLESPFATDDLACIMSMHAAVGDKVTYSEQFETGVNLTTLDGKTLFIKSTDTGVKISSANLVQKDLYGSNGVIHLVDKLLLPKGALELTPEKYLLALNCTSFVALLHAANLTSLINDTTTQYTILAPRDDVFTLDTPEEDIDLERKLRYHFLPGLWTPEQLSDGMLVQTALLEEGLDGKQQVMPIEVKDKSKNTIKKLRFAGAGVVSDEYLTLTRNNTIVYFISRPLSPPSDPLQVALPSLDLSSFLAAVFSSNDVAMALKTASSKTILIPHNAAFQRLGILVSAHLLADSPASKADLRLTLLHHALDGVYYGEALVNGSQRTFSTLEGSDVTLHRSRNVTVLPSGGWSGMTSSLTTTNMLTSTGVIHEIEDLLLPRSVKITVSKLVKAAGGTTMAGLLTRAGMDWVLNGTAPPGNSRYADHGPGGWTLLCPHDDAFDRVNLTELKSDRETLNAVISQHLIPSPMPIGSNAQDTDDPNDHNNRPVPLDDDVSYPTLLSPLSSYADVVFRSQPDGGYVVGLKGVRGTSGRHDWAQVTAWGRTSSSSSAGTGGVIQIDRLLLPYRAPWYLEYGPPVAVGLGGISLVVLFFAVVRWFWKRDATEATYEPIGGFGADDGDS